MQIPFPIHPITPCFSSHITRPYHSAALTCFASVIDLRIQEKSKRPDRIYNSCLDWYLFFSISRHLSTTLSLHAPSPGCPSKDFRVQTTPIALQRLLVIYCHTLAPLLLSTKFEKHTSNRLPPNNRIRMLQAILSTRTPAPHGPRARDFALGTIHRRVGAEVLGARAWGGGGCCLDLLIVLARFLLWIGG